MAYAGDIEHSFILSAPSEPIMSCKLPLEASNDYELRFDSLFIEGRGMSFPCDAGGHVDLDNLSERARTNYLYARAVVGREFRTPAVRLRDLH